MNPARRTCSPRSVLLLVAAVLPSASAQSVCQTGWTQSPNSSDWGNKCYREYGPPKRDPEGMIICPDGCGYTYGGCKAHCKNESATARILCPASQVEMDFVTNQAYLDGWVAYTQNTSSSDYAEPAGGWGWECGSTYEPLWELADDGGVKEPNGRGTMLEDVSCAVLERGGKVVERQELPGRLKDQSCLEGNGDAGDWPSHRALLGPNPRCCARTHTHALTTHTPLRSALRVRGRPETCHRLRGPEL